MPYVKDMQYWPKWAQAYAVWTPLDRLFERMAIQNESITGKQKLYLQSIPVSLNHFWLTMDVPWTDEDCDDDCLMFNVDIDKDKNGDKHQKEHLCTIENVVPNKVVLWCEL